MTYKRQRPTGVTILGVLYVLGGIFATIGAIAVGIIASNLGGIPFLGSAAILIGGAAAFFLGILAIIEFVIGGALLSGKSWGRKIVIVFAIIDLLLEVAMIILGNTFAVIGVIMDLIVLYYMWRPHVIEYFRGYPITYASYQSSQKTEQVGCPQCGSPISASSNFCSKCGSKLKSCSQCRTVNMNEATFCSKCGFQFT